jgi:ribosome-binding factor A
MSSRRPERVRGLLLEVVAEILLREVKDPRVEGITLTGVDITPDLKLAKVYFSMLRPENHDAALAGLKSATGYIKRQISMRLQLRHTPELRFLYDTTLEKANRLEHLLRQIEKVEQEKS